MPDCVFVREYQSRLARILRESINPVLLESYERVSIPCYSNLTREYQSRLTRILRENFTSYRSNTTNNNTFHSRVSHCTHLSMTNHVCITHQYRSYRSNTTNNNIFHSRVSHCTHCLYYSPISSSKDQHSNTNARIQVQSEESDCR